MTDSIYTRTWDHYVDVDWELLRERRKDPDLRWPGDEWGHPKAWEDIYQLMFVMHGGVESWRKAVEIGQGSGKYTLKVLQNPDVSIRAYDISERFLEVCALRCEDEIEQGRLSLHQLDPSRPTDLLDQLKECGWRRELDAFYSIDTMVHLDLQYLMAYLITAAATLRKGGKLVLTLATPTSDGGFERLVGDVTRYWRPDTPHGFGRLEWVSECVMQSLLPRLGFRVEYTWEPPEGIYLVVIASLRRPKIGDELAARLY